MKRTTYIMAGMLVAGLVTIAGLVGYVVMHKADNNNSLAISGASKTTVLPPCKVVQLKLKQDVPEDRRWITFGGSELTMQPVDSPTGSFAYPADLDKYMSMQSNGDTLNIVWDFSTGKLEEPIRKFSWFSVDMDNISINIPQTVEEVEVYVNGLTTVFKDFSRDSFFFNIRNTARVENCRFTSLHAQAGSLRLESGEVQDLYLNLDNVGDWNTRVESFRIDTQHLSGSREHRNHLQKGECRRVLWTPLTEEAALNLKLSQAACLEMK